MMRDRTATRDSGGGACGKGGIASLLAVVAVGGACLLPGPAWSQSDEPAPSEPAPDETELDPVMLEPVKVTARKIEELLRDIPFAVSAIAQPRLQDERTDNLQELVREVPNVSISTLGDGRSTWFSMRGIGPMSQPLGYDDTSVVTYVDGVPQPLFASDVQFLDVERVEVLRGPQGTVFGRNAQGGAINIVTQLPSDDLEISGRAEVGENWYRYAQVSLSGPLIQDRLSARFAASYSGVNGDVPNLATGDDVGGYQNGEFRGSFVATPGDDTELTLSVFGQRDNNTPSNFVLKGTDGFPEVAMDPEGGIERNLGGVALTVTHSFDAFAITSVSAYNHYDYSGSSDNSEALTFSALFGVPPENFLPATDFSNMDEAQNTFYQELRLSSLADAAISWVAGATYYRDSYSLSSYYQSAFFVSNNGTRDNDYLTNSYAAFGEATVPVPGLAGLSATFGLRYTHDTKDYDANFWGNGFPGTVGFYQQDGTLDFGMVTGRAALSYEISEVSTIYATVARGAKSGGFPNFTNNAASGLPDGTYKESTSWTYEIGAKNAFLGGRALVNVALFFNDVKDENLFAFDSSSFSFVPLPIDTQSYGAELEVAYRIQPGLDLFGSVGYTHAEVRNVSADVAASSGAADGNTVPNVPKFNTSLTLQYRGSARWLGLSDADLLGMVQHQFVGARAADVGNHFDLASYNMVNTKLGLQFDRLDIYVFGQNLTDARPEYIGLYYGPGVEAVTVGYGRIVGVGAQVNF